MSLTTRTRRVGNVSIVDLNGKITLGESTLILREALSGLLSEGNKNIVVNMAAVTYVDSAGLGELVAKYTTSNKQGGALKLLNLPGKLKSLLQMTNLQTIFPVFDDEQAAIASFGAATSI